MLAKADRDEEKEEEEALLLLRLKPLMLPPPLPLLLLTSFKPFTIAASISVQFLFGMSSKQSLSSSTH